VQKVLSNKINDVMHALTEYRPALLSV